jgi:hypothetical protein
MSKIFTAAVLLFFMVLGSGLSAQGNKTETSLAEAWEMLAKAQELYGKGDYKACLSLVNEFLSEAEKKPNLYTPQVLAAFYVLKSFVVYAFREEGYQEEINRLLLLAVQNDIRYEFEDPTTVPLYVLEQFRRIKREYLAQFLKSTRRHVLGLYGGLILQPSVLKNPAIIQPGIHYAYNLSDAWALWINLAFPTQIPLLESIQGSLGATWFPTFNVETVSLGLSMAYAFKLEHYESLTHSILFEGYGEVIFRFGLGFGASVELLRFDLFFGGEGMELPEYGNIELFPNSSLRIAFANLRFYLFYTF